VRYFVCWQEFGLLTEKALEAFIKQHDLLKVSISVEPEYSRIRSKIVGTVVGGVPARALMSTDKYAQKALAQTPAYDREAYRRDKVPELLRLYPQPW
jgi:hypothetical protein